MITKKPLTILLVEDSPTWCEDFTRMFTDDGNFVVLTKTIKETEERLSQNVNFDLIVMDGCVPGDALNTLPLIKKIRNEFNFKGYMMASSSDSDNLELMKKAGCNHGVEKWELMDYLRSKEYVLES